jgi:hypothetical protein
MLWQGSSCDKEKRWKDFLELIFGAIEVSDVCGRSFKPCWHTLHLGADVCYSTLMLDVDA